MRNETINIPRFETNKKSRSHWAGLLLFKLYVSVLTDDIGDARTILMRIQVVMTDNQSLRIATVQVLEQQPECRLLLCGTRIGGLTADVEPTLVADADRVGIMVLAVGSDHVFRTAWLNLSVTTDHVVVADAELKAPLAVPGINLSGRARLIGPHCRTVNNYQCYQSHNLTCSSA